MLRCQRSVTAVPPGPGGLTPQGTALSASILTAGSLDVSSSAAHDAVRPTRQARGPRPQPRHCVGTTLVQPPDCPVRTNYLIFSQPRDQETPRSLSLCGEAARPGRAPVLLGAPHGAPVHTASGPRAPLAATWPNCRILRSHQQQKKPCFSASSAILGI